MIKCTYISLDEFQKFNEIVHEKRGQRNSKLNGLKTVIRNCYNDYSRSYDSLLSSNTSILDPLDKEALNHCYSSPTAAFIEVRGRIFQEQPAAVKLLCPYCFLNEPNTLDHHICESEFSEFSVMAQNLIPCCSQCNLKKGVIWREHGKRSFIHFYNDGFIKEQFLFAEIGKVSGVPLVTFKLVKPFDFTITQFEIVTSHFNKLELLDKYSKRSNILLSTELKAAQQIRLKGVSTTQISQSFLARAQSEYETYGQNYWKAVLIQEMGTTLSNII